MKKRGYTTTIGYDIFNTKATPGRQVYMPCCEENRKAVLGGEALPKVNKPHVRFDVAGDGKLLWRA